MAKQKMKTGGMTNPNSIATVVKKPTGKTGGGNKKAQVSPKKGR